MKKKIYFVKYRYKDEEKVRKTFIEAYWKDQAKLKVQRMHNFKIEILDCYQFN